MNYSEKKTENKKNKTSVSGLIYVIRVPEKGNGAEKYYF